MCTAIGFKTKDFYFGRTLDWDFLYPAEVTVMPRNFPLPLSFDKALNTHYAVVGMAYVKEEYPLYFDGVNEKGLCMAGLNFVGNAAYRKAAKNAENVAQYEFLPYILSKCASVKEVKIHLKSINLTDTPFTEDLPAAGLHWLVADVEECITVEAVKEGLFIYPNKVGVLTNNPPFPLQIFALNNYMHLSQGPQLNRFSRTIELCEYSRGMGALGLPGDFSSQSRFVRAAFVKLNSVSGDSEEESVNRFFHIMSSVAQPKGCCVTCEGKFERTLYTSCMNAQRGRYYYTTYENHQLTLVDMFREDLSSQELIRYPLVAEEQIKLQN